MVFAAPPMASTEHLLFFAVANITIKPWNTFCEFIKKKPDFLHAYIIYRANKQRESNHTTYKKGENQGLTCSQ